MSAITKPPGRCCRAAHFAAICALLTALCGGSAYGEALLFSQLDVDLDGTVYNDTEWGALDLTYGTQAQIQYLNVAVNGVWQLQNIPLVSGAGASGDETLRFSFDLGVARGVNVPSLSYAYSITPAVANTMPGTALSAPVQNASVTSHSGFADQYFRELGSPGSPRASGAVAAQPSALPAGSMPNQPCMLNECAPAAVSNSLNFLRVEKGLTVPGASDITIEKAKLLTGWGPKWIPREGGGYVSKNACWASEGDHYDPSVGVMVHHLAWWQVKKLNMEANSWPITTRTISFGTTAEDRRRAMQQLCAEIDSRQDVELGVLGHVVVLDRIVPIEDGTYDLYVKHDVCQRGNSADCVTEHWRYEPANGLLSGALTAHESIYYAVVECPEPTALIPLVVGLLLSGLRRRR